jgi:hypothetical protein
LVADGGGDEAAECVEGVVVAVGGVEAFGDDGVALVEEPPCHHRGDRGVMRLAFSQRPAERLSRTGGFIDADHDDADRGTSVIGQGVLVDGGLPSRRVRIVAAPTGGTHSRWSRIGVGFGQQRAPVARRRWRVDFHPG